eukprot:m.93391 g.93391  ORF g.93391 m.93391 type:complete len:50 (-) comp20292_c0_seq3:2473-2622(-)
MCDCGLTAHHLPSDTSFTLPPSGTANPMQTIFFSRNPRPQAALHTHHVK